MGVAAAPRPRPAPPPPHHHPPNKNGICLLLLFSCSFGRDSEDIHGAAVGDDGSCGLLRRGGRQHVLPSGRAMAWPPCMACMMGGARARVDNGGCAVCAEPPPGCPVSVASGGYGGATVGRNGNGGGNRAGSTVGGEMPFPPPEPRGVCLASAAQPRGAVVPCNTQSVSLRGALALRCLALQAPVPERRPGSTGRPGPRGLPGPRRRPYPSRAPYP